MLANERPNSNDKVNKSRDKIYLWHGQHWANMLLYSSHVHANLSLPTRFAQYLFLIEGHFTANYVVNN